MKQTTGLTVSLLYNKTKLKENTLFLNKLNNNIHTGLIDNLYVDIYS